MADVFSTEKRRSIMQAVRRKGTAPERLLTQLLSSRDIFFTCNDSDLPGKPDIIFPKEKLIVFVHGCFWHGHQYCSKGRKRPKTRSDYWREKINRNKRRDLRVARKLRAMGYSVYTVWECEICREGIPKRLLSKIITFRRHS